MHASQESELTASSLKLTGDIPRNSEAGTVWRAPGLVVGEDASQTRAEKGHQQTKRTAPNLIAVGGP